MVIYGMVGQSKDGTKKNTVCIHGGAAFIIPFVQAYEFLDLSPIQISIDYEKNS